MPWEQPLFKLTGLVAGADLRTKQYYAVKLDNASAVVLTGAAGESAVGILQNKPNVGEACEILVIGVTPMVAGAQITLPNFLQADNGGKMIAAATTGHHKVGFAIEAAAADAAVFTGFVNFGTGVV